MIGWFLKSNLLVPVVFILFIFPSFLSETKFSPEELVAMILTKAKEYAESFALQQVTECVITVPAFFNQAERRAMLKAAELAGIKGVQKNLF